MKEFAPKYLDITQDNILHAAGAINEFENESQYASSATMRLISDHDFIYEYLSQQKTRAKFDEETFEFASTITYDMLPSAIREIPLSFHDIHNAKESIKRHTIGNKKNARLVNLEWLVDELEEDSPDFMNWMSDVLEEIEPENKSAFLFGSLLTVLPFYLRGQNQTV